MQIKNNIKIIYTNIYAHLAQWIERQTSNLEVEGSSPPLGFNYFFIKILFNKKCTMI